MSGPHARRNAPRLGGQEVPQRAKTRVPPRLHSAPQRGGLFRDAARVRREPREQQHDERRELPADQQQQPENREPREVVAHALAEQDVGARGERFRALGGCCGGGLREERAVGEDGAEPGLVEGQVGLPRLH